MTPSGPQDPSPRSPPSVRRTSIVTIAIALAALLPVAMLSVFSYRMASARMQELVHGSNITAAHMTAELVRSDLSRNIDMARALAAQPGMVAAVQQHNADAVRDRLRATITAVNQASTNPVVDESARQTIRRIDRAYVTDPKGVEWSDFPYAPESIGKDFSDRDWFRGVSRNWQPYLSEVYLRNAEPRILIVAMAAPIRDPDGKVIGIIVLQMPVRYLSEMLRTIQVGVTGHVYVVDKKGVVVAHPKLPETDTRVYREPATSEPIRKALSGRESNGDYTDPVTGMPMVAAFSTVLVVDGAWAVVAQQPADDVYAPIRQMRTSIMVASGILAAISVLIVGRLRNSVVRDRRMTLDLEAKSQRLAQLARTLEQTATSERSARVEAQEAHATLRKAQGQLVQAEKLAALGQLVAGVAHEINNPLAFVMNNVAVLQRDIEAIGKLIALYQLGEESMQRAEPALMQCIRDLAEQIDLPYTMTEIADLPLRTREGLIRIQQIVKDLRDFARQNAIGEIEPSADVNNGIESTLNIARGMAKKRRVELTCDLAPLPGVTCSPGKINQVVLNLLSNAVQASPEGGTVLVRSRPEAEGVCIQVIDKGTGIDPAIRDRIFDPFFTTKPQGEGTGLGLSISHGIVSEHGGRISVESASGCGTTFTVFLPLTPPPERSRTATAGEKVLGKG